MRLESLTVIITLTMCPQAFLIGRVSKSKAKTERDTRKKVRHYRASEIQVYAGKHNLQKTERGQKVRQAMWLLPHDGFDAATRDNDIGVIILTKPLKFSDTISSICPPGARISYAKHCVVTGWGLTQDTDNVESALDPMHSNTANILQQAIAQIRSTETCKNVFRSKYNENIMICAGDGHSKTCKGDSGGPLQCQEEDGSWTLDGVTSFGTEKCAPGEPSVYTRTEPFVEPWLNPIIRSHAVH